VSFNFAVSTNAQFGAGKLNERHTMINSSKEKIITKTVDVESEEVRVYGNTAVMLKKMQLTAIVYGEEHTNPFMVTEVYVKKDGWKLASLAYTKVNY